MKTLASVKVVKTASYHYHYYPYYYYYFNIQSTQTTPTHLPGRTQVLLSSNSDSERQVSQNGLGVNMHTHSFLELKPFYSKGQFGWGLVVWSKRPQVWVLP